MLSPISFIYAAFLVIFISSCAKEKTFPVPAHDAVVRPTVRQIYKVEILDANYQNCLPQDADLKPDLYLVYGYTDPISGTQHFQTTAVQPNVPYSSLPVTFVFTTPVNIYESSWQHSWYLYDNDGANLNTSVDNFLGGYNYAGQFFGQSFYYSGASTATIGYEGTETLVNTSQKHIFKFYYRWLA